jgi:hypothetical protein
MRAASLLLVLVAGSTLVSSGTAEAVSGRASRPWRSVTAPPVLLALSNYVMQPDPGEGGEGDTTDVEPPIKEHEPPPQPTGSGQPKPLPGFSTQDTTTRRDSMFSTPGLAPVETIGPSTTILPVPSAAGPPRPLGVKGRHGVFGVPPLVLLVGLIALHVFVVKVAGK